MPKSILGSCDSNKRSKIRFIFYSLSLLIAVCLLELVTRLYYNEVELIYLPYYGLSKDQHNLFIWQHQPEQQDVGTITTPYSFDVYDSTLGWRVKPNADVKHYKQGLWDVIVQTNSNGLRSTKPVSHRRLDKTIRIGIIGASQTFGESVNVNEAYVSVLDSKLHNAEVLNFGVRGYGTDQMLLYYENVVVEYDLDFIILAFAFHHIPRNISSFSFYAKPYFTKVGNGLSLSGTPVPSEYELFDKVSPAGCRSYLNKSVLLRTVLRYFRTLKERRIYNANSEVWDITKLIISRFSKAVEENNSQLILVNIEHMYMQLEPALQLLADDLDVHFINLGPMLRKAIDSGIPAQITNDNHWSSVGHQLVADAMYESLCKKKFTLNCN